MEALLAGRAPEADAQPSASTLSRGGAAGGADAHGGHAGGGAPLQRGLFSQERSHVRPGLRSGERDVGKEQDGDAAGGGHNADGGGGNVDGGGCNADGGGCQNLRLPYRALVVPAAGFGTGRARLRTDAPRTFAFLKRQVISGQLGNGAARSACMHSARRETAAFARQAS